jgi:phosphomannomutase
VILKSSYGEGWFLLRMSLHEPLFVLQVENDIVGKNILVLERLAVFFRRFSELNLSVLEKQLERV